VHDDPRSNVELVPGMVVTIEPGVYIADEELGVRIENDWLITEDGARLLSGRIPSDPDGLLDFLAQVRPR
jgi:Xaa-Pro aminopeptidase